MTTCRIRLETQPISVYYSPLVKICRGHKYILPYAALWSDISLSNYYQCFLPINFN